MTHITVLRNAIGQARIRAPFHIDGWVVLPNHMHCLWTLPEGDADFPGRWRAIKIAFSKSVPTGEPRSLVMASRGERGIWQRRYWEHTIRDDRDFLAPLDSIHFNPAPTLPSPAGGGGLGRGTHPADWPHSSFRWCVADGLYPAGWRGGGDEPRKTGEQQ